MSFFKNSLWSFTGQVGIQFLGVLTNIVLARMLYPEIFGVLGMAMVFAGVVIITQEAGLSSYIVYKTPLTKPLVSTSFWLNVILSFLLSALLFSLSGLIGDFYNNTQVTAIVKFIAIGSFLGGFFITSRAVLMREKNFKLIAKVDLISELIASISAIILAVLGYHLLAISVRYVMRPALQSIIYLSIKGKDVLGKFDIKSMKSIVPYSSNVLGTQLMAYMNNNIDYLFVGRIYGSYTLGLYTMAWQWGSLIRFYIAGSIGKVAFPELSRLNNDYEAIKVKYLDLTRKLAFIAFPICFGISAVADSFIVIFYGVEWKNVGPLLQILVLSGAINAVGSIGGQVFRATGRPKIELILSSIVFVSSLLLLFIATRFSIIYVAIAEVIKLSILESFKVKFLINHINLKVKELVSVIYGSLLSALVMFGVVKGIQLFIGSLYVSFIISIVVGFLTYMLVSNLINKTMLNWALSKLKFNR
ncbi:lipopolysaccharide biosynthesis protein [Aquibacillus saliphilus]|uniref:lipopolysaccharide biosynthesis protein n=1 Tax=Aquibacillus saliphilus TaxID=1909422 RepID=UPI001CF0A7CC|nr:lipopolysaccharide biosynthesis protein [Aquibacillus saliphilus]